jgi:hypothetical protein
MVSAASAELYTTVENASGSTRVFGFLGPRGMRLADGEVVTIPGDLVASLGALHQKGGARRKFDALERSLAAGSLVIRSRPAPILYDDTDSSAAALVYDDSTLTGEDPTYA